MDPEKKFKVIFGIPVRTVSLILLLAFIAFGLTAVALKGLTDKTLVITDNANRPITVSAQTILSISQNPIIVSSKSGSFYETDILINTNQNKVRSVQLELYFDPNVLTDVDITAGQFFQNPVELLKSVDDQNGRISYALSLPPGQTGISGNDIIATISFSLANPKLATATAVTFLPKTEVSTSTSLKSVLEKAEGAVLTLNPLVTPPPQLFFETQATRSASQSAK